MAAAPRTLPDAPAGAAVPVHAQDALQVARGLGCDPARGLGSGEVAARRAQAGANRLDPGGGVGGGRILLGQATSPVLLLLAAAGVLSAALGDTAEALVIGVVVVLDVWIGFRQEYAAATAMAGLQSLAAPTVTAIRDGATQTLAAADVVPGELLVLEAGATVAADGRLLEAHALQVDESALTGESVPVAKRTATVAEGAPLAERRSMAFAGTTVTAGRGRMVVTATGMRSQLGTIAGLLGTADPGRTPLQVRLDALVARLSTAAAGLVLLVVAIGLLRGTAVDTLLLTAVSLAVAAVPESLPAVVTITLGLGAQRMLAHRSLVRRLYAVETLGSVTTICSDKTGTLTEGRMRVAVLEAAGTRRRVGGDAAAGAEAAPPREHPALGLLLAAGALCNDASAGPDGAPVGEPTEAALVAVAARHGLRKADLERLLPRTAELPFDAVRKRMSTVHAVPARAGAAAPGAVAALGALGPAAAGAAQLACTKGAVDGLLPRCRWWLSPGGAVPLDAARRRRLAGEADALAADGLRVLGVAVRPAPAGEPLPPGPALEEDLTFVGLVGLTDPARTEARAAIATCRSAGIRAVMITGDHPLTAAAIGRELGLGDRGGRAPAVVTGPELAGLDAAALARTVRSASIYARVSPADKLRIVEALQAHGEVVAMTGDGVNDAPALRQADIGVAMGRSGTDVTREAADMVLLDDDFATIVAAVREGRVIFDNVRKFIRNILSGNLAEVGVMVLAPLAGMPIPLLPLQILWLNLVTDGLPAMAMAVEPPEPGVMDRRPTPLRASLFGGDRGRRILTRGALLLVLVLVPVALLWRAGDDAWQTVLFTAIAFAELAGGLAMRSESQSLRRLGPFTNRPMIAAIVATVALQVAVVSVPAARELLGLRPLDPAHWALVLAIALAYLAAVELEKAATTEAAA